MTNEERVERVMKALALAETPAGLEARMLARVAAGRSERSGVGFAWVWGAAVAAAVLLAMGVGV